MRVLLVGSVPRTAKLAQKIHAEHRHRLDIVGVLGRRADIGRQYQGMTVLGDVSDLREVYVQLETRGLAPAYVIAPESEIAGDQNAFLQLTSVATSLGSEVISSASLDMISHVGLAGVPASQLARRIASLKKYHRLKRMIDISAASAALLVFCPLMVLLACVCLIVNGSPILFRQVRVGRHLRDFSLLKFRTMRDPFDRKGRQLSDSERVSRLGRLLRSTRLDELPQLWNVLKGDMALIGPRPLHLRDLAVDRTIIERRHDILPGLTGWAQVNGGKLLSNDQKMALDLFYISNASFALDCKIFLLTIRMMIAGDLVNPEAIAEAEKSVGASGTLACAV